jgi:hypothetical protein
MNIQTVKTNLEKTIAGKEQLLKGISEKSTAQLTDVADMYLMTMKHMLEINLTELKRILQDVEQCIPKSECSLDGPMIKMFRED